MKTPENQGFFTRFDWYQASVEEDPEILINKLANALGATPHQVKGINGYYAGTSLRDAALNTTVVTIYWGGEIPNVKVTGESCVRVVPVFRELFPRHRVTRVDSAADFEAPGAYENIRAAMIAIATEKTTWEEQESTVNGVRARTFYLGSRQSDVRLRLYEKGKKEHQEGNTDEPGEWVRLEMQFRPSKAGKVRAASAASDEIWGFSPRTRKLASLVMEMDVQPINIHIKPVSDDLKALRALRRQWSPLLKRTFEGRTVDEFLAIIGVTE
jgi:Replication initiation factor